MSINDTYNRFHNFVEVHSEIVMGLCYHTNHSDTVMDRKVDSDKKTFLSFGCYSFFSVLLFNLKVCPVATINAHCDRKFLTCSRLWIIINFVFDVPFFAS